MIMLSHDALVPIRMNGLGIHLIINAVGGRLLYKSFPPIITHRPSLPLPIRCCPDLDLTHSYPNSVGT